jgi:hypothetical protein
MSELRREGFWRSTAEPDLRRVRGRKTEMVGKDGFITALLRKQDRASVVSYRGFSMCRLCGKGNGSQEYTLNGWVWPSGYLHYINFHNVRPSKEFRAFVQPKFRKKEEA